MRTRLRRHARRIKGIVYQETLFDYQEHPLTFLGAFLGIGLIGLLNRCQLPASDVPLLIGSFGAFSVLSIVRWPSRAILSAGMCSVPSLA